MTRLIQTAVFLASLLLFLVEPMAARQLLPRFGGSAAVWITCLVFFQTTLFLGYLYAHLLLRLKSDHLQRILHSTLIAASIVVSQFWARGTLSTGTSQFPALNILFALTCSIGLPFTLLAATIPLLQVWLSRINSSPANFRLYALSNVASLLGLLATPTLVEPNLALPVQRTLWGIGILLFAAISSILLVRIPANPTRVVPNQSAINALLEQISLPYTGRKFRHPERSEEPLHFEGRGLSSVDGKSGRRTRILWFLLPLATALQLSAVTQHLTANVAAIPLLWVLPLAAYLVSFILAFQFPTRIPRLPLIGLTAVLLIALGQFLTKPAVALPIGLALGMFLTELFVVSLLFHSELYRLRPESPRETTLFYLSIAAAGAVGSFLIGIVAPSVFSANYDLSITFAVTGAVLIAALWPLGTRQRILWTAATALLLWFCITLRQTYAFDTLFDTRNFYGTLRVTSGVSPDGINTRSLTHGTIVHGTQSFSPETIRTPTTYYAPNSGIGLAFATLRATHPAPLRAGVIGLGVGTLAAYGHPGDTFRFYEINPAVLPIAQHFFTYLRQSPATLTYAKGDARTTLAAEPTQHDDLLVIDAFSGDAVPLHLLTTQAIALYQRHLTPDGILAFHISNQYVDLEPELAALAHQSGLTARTITSPDNEATGELRATWVLMSANSEFFDTPTLAQARHVPDGLIMYPWTDDRSSLLPLVRW
jgi:hypothetical protein